MRNRWVLAGAFVLTLALCISSATASPIEDTAVALESRARAEGKGLDQETNPAYRAAQDAAPPDGEYIDPFRRGWNGVRGHAHDVRFDNRYGAELAGILFRPLADGRYPAIVVLPGLGGWANDYSAIAQQLAEHGYVVLVVEPQGQHNSEIDPDPEYCGDSGWWREPQEAGLVETHACAGHGSGEESYDTTLSPLAAVVRGVEPTLGGAVDIAGLMVELRTNPDSVLAQIREAYEAFRARFTFAGIDAADWLVSDGNPWNQLVDPDRIGIAGHSAGADGAVVAGNAHREGLFKAAVAWDTFGELPAALQPTVPTMWQQSEQQLFMGPFIPAPDPELFEAYDSRDRFLGAGVDNALVALRGSTHQEWLTIPDSFRQPMANSSAEGLQVATYYSLAWFDLYLKGDSGAVDRLTSATFDDSVDGTSIGTGRYDPLTQKNVPHTLDGETVQYHLSGLFRSSYSVGEATCSDIVGGAC